MVKQKRKEPFSLSDLEISNKLVKILEVFDECSRAWRSHIYSSTWPANISKFLSGLFWNDTTNTFVLRDRKSVYNDRLLKMGIIISI